MSVNLSAKQAKQVVTDAAFIGSVVTWDFGIGKKADACSVPRAEFEQMLTRLGYNATELGLEMLTEEEALERARTLGWGSRIKVVRLQAEKGMPASFGVMRTHLDGVEDASANVGCRIRLALGGKIEIAPPLIGRLDPECSAIAEKVVEFANNLATRAVNRDISTVLLNIVKEMGAIPMRHNTGGAYFMPVGKKADTFVALLEGLEQMTFQQPRDEKFYAHITVLRGDQRNVNTWHRNTTLAFDLELVALKDELTNMTTRDNVRDGTWDKKKTECTGLVLRAKQYAGLLQGEYARIEKLCLDLEAKFGKAQDAARATALGAKAAFDKFADKPVPAAPQAAPVPAPAPVAQAPAKRRLKDPRKAFANLG
jgi:hypothetical protein